MGRKVNGWDLWNNTFPTYIDQMSQNVCHLYSGMGLQFGGIWVFPAITITVICQARMYCCLSVKIKHVWNATRSAKIVDAFSLRLFPRVWSAKNPEFSLCLFPRVWSTKNPNTPYIIGAPWLTTPFHGAVYEFRDLFICDPPLLLVCPCHAPKCLLRITWSPIKINQSDDETWECPKV